MAESRMYKSRDVVFDSHYHPLIKDNKMINEHDIEDLCPNYYASPEEILHDDRAYWYDVELQGLKLPEVWGKYILGDNVRSYEFNINKGYYG